MTPKGFNAICIPTGERTTWRRGPRLDLQKGMGVVFVLLLVGLFVVLLEMMCYFIPTCTAVVIIIEPK